MTRSFTGSDGAHLPAPLTSFVGRETELGQIAALLERGRLLTLTGAGGIGKSRLAAAAAAELAPGVGGRVWFVELAALADPELLIELVAQTLGIVESEDRGLPARLGGPPALLVLDNCEHLVDACAGLVEALLHGCPELLVLATSREPLGLVGETTLAVAPLGVCERDDPTAAEAGESAAVRLFVERAAGAEPTFALDDGNAAVVSEICRRLDGIPLGLELAAVRLRTVPLAQLFDRLEDQLTLTNLNKRNAGARHLTLAATLDWSHRLLDPSEQALWRRLAVFSGGFSLEAVEAVCADERLPAETIFDRVTSLAEKSIVVFDRRSLPVRYRLLEPVRLYGRQRLCEAGEEHAVRRRHLAWCIEQAGGAVDPWWSGREQLEWLNRVSREQANVRAALDFAATDPLLHADGLKLAVQASHTWLVRGWYGDLRHYLHAFAEHDATPRHDRARARYAEGVAALIPGDMQRARECFDECRVLAHEGHGGGFELEQALATYGAGLTELQCGDVLRARSILRTAIDAFEAAGAPVMQTSAILFLVESYLGSESDVTVMRGLVRKSLAVSMASGDLWNRARAHHWLGMLAWGRGRTASAEKQFRAALELQQALGHRFGVAESLDGLAWTATASRPGRAAILLGAADALREALKTPLSPRIRAGHFAAERVARNTLGSERYMLLHARGSRLSQAEAVHRALAAASPDDDGTADVMILTRREMEIAKLVAAGATNREIAAALVISDQTVKSHLHHILGKLGFRSRVEVASWHASLAR